MIQVEGVTKHFGDTLALNALSCTIPDGCVYGLVGSNGAGKSTLLRLIAGIYRPESGAVFVDAEGVWENPSVKERVFFVPDELFFLPQASMHRMARLYAANYRRFSQERFTSLVNAFGLNPNAPIQTFSRGMRRQAATILALSCRTKYYFFDETFDGLDPVMRNLMRRTIYEDVEHNGSTYVITSHSLRELEDTCDQLALLHKGGVVFERDVQNLNTSLFKVQTAFAQAYDKRLFEGIDLLSFQKHGSVSNLIVRGDREEVTARLRLHSPLLLEILPLTLEEIFLYEMEALGYSFPEILNEEAYA